MYVTMYIANGSRSEAKDPVVITTSFSKSFLIQIDSIKPIYLSDFFYNSIPIILSFLYIWIVGSIYSIYRGIYLNFSMEGAGVEIIIISYTSTYNIPFIGG